MESMTGLMLLLLLVAGCVQGDFREPPQPDTDLQGFTDAQTRLPCWYQPEADQRMVQVTWEKVFPNGTSRQIITAHFTEGIKAVENSDRVMFETYNPISESSALLIKVTKVSDAGVYRCHIVTYPLGNFDRTIKLTVWMLPITAVELEDLVEGQAFGVVATCRAVGYPKPGLSWDTELPGYSRNHTGEDGKTFIQYSLHPLRSMNGKKLDCLVWHPSLKEPRRVANHLVVQYPPDPIISSSPSNWQVGLQKAELVCEGRGNPTPQNVIWTRRGEALPDGVSVVGEKLVFGRPVQLNDSGTYECTVKNTVGSGKTQFRLAVSEPRNLPLQNLPQQSLVLIIVCAVAGALFLVLLVVILVVKRRHLRKTKKLKMELQETKDEISTLSRQASFRRLNSTGSVSRIQPEDYALLRVDSRTKYSQMSLEPSHYHGSQSTLGGRWGPTVEVPRDEYGRPVVWTEDRECLRAVEMNREKEERRKRVESFVKNSNMSLDSGLPSSLVPLKVQQDDGNGHKESDLGHLQEDDSVVESSTTEEHEDDEGRRRHHLEGTLSKMFYESNGVLRPRENPNAILLPSQNYYKPQLI
ncbi:nectin-4-like isoform X1 [Poecilia latipinna]|uniref:Nectin-4-like n=1 Tax=Poecilia latipinna TaxID=48699 RepID=A0A3B3TUL6_9TELE|nr:PREDICTED: nectin-4-like isoform X1 [Poecilia latipinna]